MEETKSKQRNDHEPLPETELKKRAVLRMSNAQSRQLTRECIQTALIYLMNEKPFDKITITSIIKRSGVSRAGFYRNYSSKEDVLRDIESKIYQRLSEAEEDTLYQTNPYQFYRDYFRKIQNHKEEFRLFTKAQLPPDFIFEANAFLRKAHDTVSSYEYYRSIGIRVAMAEIVLAWLENDMKETPEEMAEICLRIFPQPE